MIFFLLLFSSLGIANILTPWYVTSGSWFVNIEQFEDEQFVHLIHICHVSFLLYTFVLFLFCSQIQFMLIFRFFYHSLKKTIIKTQTEPEFMMFLHVSTHGLLTESIMQPCPCRSHELNMRTYPEIKPSQLGLHPVVTYFLVSLIIFFLSFFKVSF